MHWGLFVFFGSIENASTFFEFALEPGYSFMLETVCIHLLRYVIVSLVLARRKDILRLVLPVVDKMGDRFGDEFGELMKILGRTFAYEEVPEIVKRIAKVKNPSP